MTLNQLLLILTKLSDTQIQSLSQAQIQSMTPDQLLTIPSRTTSTQPIIKILATTQIPYLTNNQLISLKNKLTYKKAFLTEGQIAALTVDQKKNF